MRVRTSLATGALFALSVWLSADPVLGQTILYSTGFEVEEGYDPEFSLVGQNDWVGTSTSGNGLATNFITGYGQQGYVGFTPLEDKSEFLSVYRPINLAPVPASQPVIKFSVLLRIVDTSSTNGPWDDFRWSVYNTNGTRLFSLDFDNASLQVSYLLDDNQGFVFTGAKFESGGTYELGVSMNFARNLWSATLNDDVIAHSLPISKTGAALNLGDIDAVWYPRNPGAPGDNFMVFDDYTIIAEAGSAIPPRLEPIRMGSGGAYQARFYGEPGLVYRVEISSDLRQWHELLSVTAPQSGVLDFQDPTAVTQKLRFYRVRQAQ